MKTKPVAMDLLEFCDMTKTLRMLYGVVPARDFFEKNFNEFTGMQLKDLQKLVKRANIDTTLEN